MSYIPLRLVTLELVDRFDEVVLDLVSASLCLILANFSTDICFRPCSLDLAEGAGARPLMSSLEKKKKK